MSSLKSFLACFLCMALLAACDSDDKETTRFNLRMTDAPLNAEAVLIDLQTIVIKGENDARDSIKLTTNAGIYDLLDYQNGVDTLIGYANLQMAQVKEIRLILGDDNSIVVGGDTLPMKTPSAQQSGLKIKTNIDLVPGEDYELLIDFDAEESVIQKGNGEYQLKPVIRVVD